MTDDGLPPGKGNGSLPARDGRKQKGAGKLAARGRRIGRQPAAFFGGRDGSDCALGAGLPAEHVDYSAMLRKLWRRKFRIIAIAVLGTGTAAAFIAQMSPHYVGHAFVVVGDSPTKGRVSYTSANQGSAAVFVPDTGTIQTEVEVLKSPRLAIEIIRDLKLHDDPEFNPAALQGEKPSVLAWLEESLLSVKRFFGPQAAPRSAADAAAAELSQHQRFRLSHLLVHQRQERALLGQVPLQDDARHQELDQRGGRAEDRP